MCCRRHQVDKKTCLAPMSSPRLQTMRRNTGTDSQVTHTFCSDVEMCAKIVPVCRLLRNWWNQISLFIRASWWFGGQPCTCKVLFFYSTAHIASKSFLCLFSTNEAEKCIFKIRLHPWVAREYQIFKKQVEKQLVLGSNWCIFDGSAQQLGIRKAVVVVVLLCEGELSDVTGNIN